MYMIWAHAESSSSKLETKGNKFGAPGWHSLFGVCLCWIMIPKSRDGAQHQAPCSGGACLCSLCQIIKYLNKMK